MLWEGAGVSLRGEAVVAVVLDLVASLNEERVVRGIVVLAGGVVLMGGRGWMGVVVAANTASEAIGPVDDTIAGLLITITPQLR